MALRAAIEFFQMSKKVAKGDFHSGHTHVRSRTAAIMQECDPENALQQRGGEEFQLQHDHSD
jgi:hypothetical protein